jgi:diguanylate cyclase (GGDEF)-like protein
MIRATPSVGPGPAEETVVTETTAEPAGDTLAFLMRAADAMVHGSDLDTAIETILAGAIGALGAGRGAVTIRDRDPIGEGGMPVEIVVTDPAAGPDDAGPAITADLPLLVTNDAVERELGSVRFSWAERAFADAPPELAGATADLLAATIDRFQLAALVAERGDWHDRMAQTDALTGIANARTFARILELELARAGRQGSEVSVAIFDVDGLSEINEGVGRKAGDDVLRAVAAVLGESVRLVDTVARYGGDEFVVVAPGAAGATVAQRVIDGVNGLASIGDRPIGVSAGVARFPADATTADGLLVAAERALVEARGGGIAMAGEGTTDELDGSG